MQGEVTTTGRLLDRETKSNYTLTVIACHTNAAADAATTVTVDAATCSANISLSLSVTILDLNDNSPRFDQISHSTTLLGNEPIGWCYC